MISVVFTALVAYVIVNKFEAILLEHQKQRLQEEARLRYEVNETLEEILEMVKTKTLAQAHPLEQLFRGGPVKEPLPQPEKVKDFLEKGHNLYEKALETKDPYEIIPLRMELQELTIEAMDNRLPNDLVETLQHYFGLIIHKEISFLRFERGKELTKTTEEEKS
jgi:hypothetical protein